MAYGHVQSFEINGPYLNIQIERSEVSIVWVKSFFGVNGLIIDQMKARKKHIWQMKAKLPSESFSAILFFSR